MIKNISGLIFLLGFFSIQTYCYGQLPGNSWVHGITDSLGAGGEKVATDDFGNAYIMCFFSETVDLDPGPNTAMFSGSILLKYTSIGAYEWAFKIDNANFSSMFLDKKGRIYLAGNFSATADFDPGPGIVNLTASRLTESFVAVYDTGGAYLLAFNFGGKDYYNITEQIAVDIADNIYISGKFSHTADFDPGPGVANLTAFGSDDMFLAKYNANGDYQWAFNIKGNMNVINYINSITADYLGNIYITGGFSEAIDFDPGPGVAKLNSAGYQDIFIAKYNTIGAYQWGLKAGGQFDDAGYDLAVDDKSNIYVTGYYRYSASFQSETGAINLPGTGEWIHLFLLKLNTEGKCQWALQIGSEGGNAAGLALRLDALTNIYITGYLDGNSTPKYFDFDPGQGTSNIIHYSCWPKDCWHGFIAKYSHEGEYQWAFPIESNYGMHVNREWSTVYPNSIAIHKKQIFITGSFSGTADFDPGTGEAIITSAAPLSNGHHNLSFFIAKYEQTPPVASFSSTAITMCEGDTVSFSDLSSESPNKWHWLFPGAIPPSSILQNPIVKYESPGIFDVTLIAGSSQGTDTLTFNNYITVHDNPSVNAGSDQSMIQGSSVQLVSTEQGNSYSWKPSAGLSCTACKEPLASPLQTTIYYLTITNWKGCSATDSVTVFVDIPELFVPNIFSPNSDGVNDKLFVHGRFKSVELAVFNRWGQKVFESSDQNIGWDGTFKGQALDPGVFAYVVKVIYLDGRKETKQGNVTLIR